MGAGFLAASLAGQPAAAYQATFNLQVANVANQSTRTFIDGPPSNHTMVMTVDNGSSSAVTTSPIDGLCNISSTCGVVNEGTLRNNFSFSKPIKDFSFKVGLNTSPLLGWDGANFNTFLRLRIGLTTLATIPLASLTAGNTIYSFTPSILFAANTAINVGFSCVGTGCGSGAGDGQFYISDVIVEAPAPLPLIGTSAAFAWTRRLRRRIKATPRPIMNG